MHVQVTDGGLHRGSDETHPCPLSYLGPVPVSLLRRWTEVWTCPLSALYQQDGPLRVTGRCWLLLSRPPAARPPCMGAAKGVGELLCSRGPGGGGLQMGLTRETPGVGVSQAFEAWFGPLSLDLLVTETELSPLPRSQILETGRHLTQSLAEDGACCRKCESHTIPPGLGDPKSSLWSLSDGKGPEEGPAPLPRPKDPTQPAGGGSPRSLGEPRPPLPPF